MVGESSLIEPANSPWKTKVDEFFFAGLLLDSKEFTSKITVFPGTNCLNAWGGLDGDFFISSILYVKGKRIGEIHSQHCDASGHIELDFDEFTSIYPGGVTGLILSSFHHSENIPVEMYAAHIHKATDTYVSYPSLPFMGDTLYPVTHQTQLENTLFWPGIPENEKCESLVFILNPYKLSFSYQLSLFLANGERRTSQPFKVKPFQFSSHSVREVFQLTDEDILKHQGQLSLCVAAQYKVVAYTMVRDRESKAITTIDHFHSYCLF